VESINQRLTFYKKIADASAEADLEEIAGELRERFGSLPEPVLHLLRGARLKIAAEKLGVKTLDWREDSLRLSFHPQSPVAPEKIVAALKEAPPGSSLTDQDRLVLRWGSDGPQGRFNEAFSLLQSLE
jgi:transcription-repair coupling factor (superfamily II helicase)